MRTLMAAMVTAALAKGALIGLLAGGAAASLAFCACRRARRGADEAALAANDAGRGTAPPAS